MSDSNHETAKCDFFVSYHHRDEPWAEWIAWRLNKAGYTVTVQPWDLAAGSKFVSEMRKAASRAERMIAVLSSNYLESNITPADWAFAFQQDPRGDKGLLFPVRVQKRELPPILDPLDIVDFVDADATECRRRLLNRVCIDRRKTPEVAISPDDTITLDADRARQSATGATLARALARWRDKYAFLQVQLAKISCGEKSSLISRLLDDAEEQIGKLQAACEIASADAQREAANALKPMFPVDSQDSGVGLGTPFLTARTPDGRSRERRERFELLGEKTLIGRHHKCDIVVEVKTVSRVHAKITRRGEQFLVEDCNSRNGTYLNGELLQGPELLREGDRIRLSKVEFVFQHRAARSEDESSVDGLNLLATSEAKLEALMRINANLGNALDEVLPSVLESLFDIFPSADRGFVVMENDCGELVPRWVKHRRKTDQTETVGINRAVIRMVMDSREAILSLDVDEDSRFGSRQSIADSSIRSMICAPLCDGEGKAFGALQIDSAQGRGQFKEDDVDLLAGVAAQAGIVIDNARMQEQAVMRQEVEQDLKLATDVQRAFLPQQPPTIATYRFSNFHKAAHHIGGDYYDYISLPDGRTAIVVADIVGRGVAAAMFMAKLSAETRFCLASEPNLAEAIERLNERLSDLRVDRFVTFLMLVVDPKSPIVTMVNAGHMPPIVRMATDGSLSEPGKEESGLPIAIDSAMEYEAVEFEMNCGDIAVMFTDGINDAMNGKDEEFGVDRVRALVAQGGDADQIEGRIASAVLEHMGPIPAFDDMCLVVIERIDD